MKELHVKSLLPVRLDKYLMDQFPALGMGRLNKALRENKIKLNGKKQPLSTRVQNGDIIKLFLNDDQLENRPTPAAVFVYEDDDIIIVRIRHMKKALISTETAVIGIFFAFRIRMRGLITRPMRAGGDMTRCQS